MYVSILSLLFSVANITEHLNLDEMFSLDFCESWDLFVTLRSPCQRKQCNNEFRQRSVYSGSMSMEKRKDAVLDMIYE